MYFSITSLVNQFNNFRHPDAQGKAKNIKITPEAAKWRDVGPTEKKVELALRISLIVGAILFLIGIAVAIYFCATTSSSYTDCTGVYESSNAPLAIIPAIIGTPMGVGMLVGGILMDFEGRGEDLDDEVLFEEHKLFLTKESDATKVYNKYRDHNMGSLVRKGVISVAQANKLRDLIKAYDKNLQTKARYDRSKILAEEKNHIGNYTRADKEIKKFADQLQKIQSEIAANFNDETINS